MPKKILESFMTELGGLSLFCVKLVKKSGKGKYEWHEFLKQSYHTGVNTLPLIGLTGFILGIVLTLQTQPVFTEFGADAWLPGMIALSIIKEIGPVVSALICAGKIGSGIGAELGSMRVTEQIDAMEISGTNPIKYLVSTRVLATTLVVPLLVIYADVLSLMGSYFAINIHGSISLKFFFNSMINSIDFIDLFSAIIKTILFGFAIGLIGCYKGYYADRGTEGVGKAANLSVVLSSLAIFIIDMIVVQIENLIY